MSSSSPPRRRRRKRDHSSDLSSDSASSDSSDYGKRRKRRSKKDRKRSDRRKKKKHAEDRKDKLQAQLEEKALRKKAKEYLKHHETPEERQRRRIEKKKQKQENLRTLEKKEYFGYSNDNNRFGDTDLTTPFVWKKKWESSHPELKGHSLRKLVTKTLRDKQHELHEEIGRIKEMRTEREAEKEAMEQLREDMQRQLEQENFEELNMKEEQFHRDQAVHRSRIRIREGREKPIDTLAKNVILFNSTSASRLSEESEQKDDGSDLEFDLELTEPYQILINLDLSELETLHTEIGTHLELGAHIDYWKNLQVVVADEIATLKQQRGNQTHLHSDVESQVEDMFKSKSHRELQTIKSEIEQRISSGGDNSTGAVDYEYWETLLKRLNVFSAKAFLKELHKETLHRRLTQLQNVQMSGQDEFLRGQSSRHDDEIMDSDDEDLMDDVKPSTTQNAICCSPKLVGKDSDEFEELELLCTLANDFYEELAEKRVNVLRSRIERETERQKMTLTSITSAQSLITQGTDNQWGTSAEQMFQREAQREPVDGEETFNSSSAEIAISRDPYWWQDKYRPRKPRFFNRVKTGYDWNKYNQTHYDHDNPPPKIVQGYKFNIFYPDLIDPTTTPGFEMKSIPGNMDYAIVKFVAGPPYEDIAFKIVNKEWEDNHKRGFKCRFERGIMQLYFSFKRFRYRR
uniref:Splicing factor Cactin n=1 Tax=Hirondellea gigas TaxID=1518452 RepID=A0A6A7G6M9_9CRUS